MSKPTEDVIRDAENGSGFDVDWDTIEENYRQLNRHSHHHRHHTEDKNFKNSSKNSNSKKKEKKKHRVRRVILIIILFLLCIVIGICAAFFILRYIGKRSMLNYDNLNLAFPSGINYEDGGNIVYYNGHKYQFNRQIATILIMGIDNTELVDNAVAGTAGQADALYLLTYNVDTGKIRVLSLNRDTMGDVIRYDKNGDYYDTANLQICLAYAYGDGKTSSAQNQVLSVERLIYNIPINSYYAIDLSAIKILNDDIGGVTLTPDYTFASFTKGVTVTLKGDMAEEYVRTRNVRLLDDNLRRIDCQIQYITSFASQTVSATLDDIRVPANLFNDAIEYTVTDIQLPAVTYLASSLALSYTGIDFISTEGEYKSVTGDPYAEYELDEDSFFETILDIFYIQID